MQNDHAVLEILVCAFLPRKGMTTFLDHIPDSKRTITNHQLQYSTLLNHDKENRKP